MKTYIAVKAVKGKAMTLAEFNQLKGRVQPGDIGALAQIEDAHKPGYLVEYPDGYQSWSPKEAFDLSHLEINEPTKISEADVERFLGPHAYDTMQLDEKTTMVKMTPRTGFVQYEVSSCVDPKNYDHQIGYEICAERIRNKLWPMLGFVLQWANYGLKPIK